MSPDKIEKLKQAVVEGKIVDTSSLATFRLIEEAKEEIKETVESKIDALKQDVSKAVSEVKESEANLPKILEAIKGKDGKDAVVDYDSIIKQTLSKIPKPKDGVSPIVDYARIISEVVSKMPLLKDGETPTIDYEFIIQSVETLIKTPKDGKDGSPDTGAQIIEKINKDDGKALIKKSKIEGFDDIEAKIQIIANRPGVSGVGGGASGIRDIRAGSNVTVSKTNDIYTISSTASGGASAFTDLTDVPSSYVGETLKGVRVNAGETGLEFYTVVDTDEKVKYAADDASAGYLGAKTIAGTGITLAEGTGGDADKLQISTSFDIADYLTTATAAATYQPIGTYVTGATDATLTLTGTTLGLNLANANTWTAKQTIQLTTEQFSLNYDGSNKTNWLVGSTGTVTTDIVGTTPILLTKIASTELGYWKPSSTQFYLGTTGSANSGTAMTVVGMGNTIHATKSTMVVLGQNNTNNMGGSIVVGRNNTMSDTGGTGDSGLIVGSSNSMGWRRGAVVGVDNTTTGSLVAVFGYGNNVSGNTAGAFGFNQSNSVTNSLRFGVEGSNYMTINNTGVFTTVAGGTTRFTVSATGVATATTSFDAPRFIGTGTNVASVGSFAQPSSGTSITTPFPAFELINTDATANNFTTFSFADAVSGASYALVGGKCTDHTNNYGEFHVWTRGTSGGSTKMEIGSNGGMVLTLPTDINLSGMTAVVPTTATTIGGTYAGLSLVNTNTTANNYARLDFLDTVNGSSSAVIVARFVNHTTKEGNLSLHVNNGGARIERIDMYTLETVVNESGGNIDFRVEGDTNANLIFVDASADLVGIGTGTPLAKLDVRHAGNSVAYFWNTAASSSSGGAGMQGFHNDGAAMASGDRLGFLTLAGAIDTSSNISSGSAVTAFATENFGATYGSDLRFETTLTGASTRASRLTIDGNADFNFFDGSDFVLGSTTGTKIGTATTQKIGFWNVTPVIQQATNAYTSDGEGAAYTGIDNLQVGTPYAQVSDLNQLRVAYETLRASYDDLLAKLKVTGIVA